MKKEYITAAIDLLKLTKNDILASSDVLINVGELFNDEKDN